MSEQDQLVIEKNKGKEDGGQFFRPTWPRMLLMVLLFVAFYALLCYVASWKFATVILVCLTVHEAGHLWAMWRCGLQLKALYFLPGLGVAAVPATNFASRGDEAFSAIMGPVWGLAAGVVAYVLHLVTGLPELASASWFCVFINLFNLLPVAPLDGGRVIRSAAHGIWPRGSVWLCGLLIMPSAFFIYQISWVFALLVGYMGLRELLVHRVVVHLEEDYLRIKQLIADGNGKYDHLLQNAAVEPTDENVDLLIEISEARIKCWSLWPPGFLPMTPDEAFLRPDLLQLYLSRMEVMPAMTWGKALFYVALYSGLVLGLIFLGMLCHSVLALAQWSLPLFS